MIDERYIKPIPKYILKLICKAEFNNPFSDSGYVRFYSYLTKNNGELAKVTVACKNNPNSKRWRCKQVIVHGVHSDKCLLKDICRHFMGNYSIGWFYEGLQKEPKWFESEDWGWQYDKYFNIYCPVLNPEYALKFPKYRYSALDKYAYTDTFKYLRLYEKYPQAEMLVKFGLSDYATSVQILKKVGTDKRFRKWIAANRAELSFKDYYAQTVLQAYKTGMPLNEAQEFLRRKKSFVCDRDYRPIRELFRGKDLERFFNYIDKQNTSYRAYLDYLKACNYLRLDMSEEKNKLPHDFKRWHDMRIDQYRTAMALKDAEERKEFYAKFAVVAEKYLPLQKSGNDMFIAVIARSPQELIREGNTLHHCVGRMNYDQKFVREETLIFFIRNTAEPDKPFVTVEYSLSQKKVLQCYGDNDTKPNDSVLEFVNKKWLPFANKQLNKIKKAVTKAA